MSEPACGQPRITVLGTGGTIAGVAAKGLGYQAGSLPVRDILAALPGTEGWLRLESRQILNVGSQAIGYAAWRKLATAVQAVADGGQADGIVITHGTDTLEETAYFLDLVIQSRIPVVLTGAMRPAHAIGSDGAANLLSALAVAASPSAAGRGVLVVMNEIIHSARGVQKMSATGVDAFASPNQGPLGWVQDRSPGFYLDESRREPGPPLFGVVPEEPALVPILYSHGGLDIRVARAMLALEPDGIVLAGVGNGNTGDDVLAELSGAAARGVAVVRATRTGSGRVVRNAEVDDDNSGFIAAGDLNPQKARILLALALNHTRDPGILQNYYPS